MARQQPRGGASLAVEPAHGPVVARALAVAGHGAARPWRADVG